ncbi:aldo-keto reductase AKR2E4-like [Trichoplusia ni]|uniref:Aldo-keto reductase AKR2E4-like n=1 Tax=Trichoplusia ni TaxID=7111 RepID=A0A7E5VFP0_TRINI|nr:aldo-keto reductase AKR2E4-like [Trichoplusia ni]
MIVLLIFCFGFNAALAVLAPVVTLNDGNKMPVFALGTGRGTAKETESLEDVKQAVIWAIEAGYRHIDTASIYGDEEQVGQGIAEAINKGLVTREEMFVTTKLWSDKHARDQVVPSLRESLKRLGLSYVDLYLIHFPSAVNSEGAPLNIPYLETWKGMEEAKRLNLTKSIGISNFNASQIQDLFDDKNGIMPAVNEIEVNPTHAQEALVSHCNNLGVAVMGYSPFGFMVSRKSANAPPPRFDDPLITTLAEKYKKTPAQIVLNWLYSRSVIPVAKSVNKKRIEENIDIFDFKLNDEEIAAIAKFDKKLRVIDFKDWKDYPYFPFEY